MEGRVPWSGNCREGEVSALSVLILSPAKVLLFFPSLQVNGKCGAFVLQTQEKRGEKKEKGCTVGVARDWGSAGTSSDMVYREIDRKGDAASQLP